MKESELYPGLLVRIRDVEDMKAEFGMGDYRRIRAKFGYYLGAMHNDLHGFSSTVRGVRPPGTVFFDDPIPGAWSVSADMPEPVDTEEPLLLHPDLQPLL